jgi:succinyl-diaminopimelate desuccinylase
VRLILGSAEETGCKDIARYLEVNEPPPNVFSPDAQYPVINVEKGRYSPFFDAKWEEDLTQPRVISITGGKTTNVVPNRAEAVIEGLALDEVKGFSERYSKITGAEIFAYEENGKIRINAEGKAAHAARPYQGCNAQTALLKMLAEMPFAKSEGFDYICKLNRLIPHGDYLGEALGIKMSDKISGDLTVNFGVLEYNTQTLSGNYDSRTPACADDIDILDKTRKIFVREGFNITFPDHTKSHVTPEEAPFVQKMLRIYEEYTGEKGTCLAMGGSTYVHGIPGGVAFGVAKQNEDNKAHGPNEFIKIDQLILSAKIFTQTIIDMCG